MAPEVKQYSESEGEFDEWQPSSYPCRYCGVVGQNFYETWESSDGAFTDYKHECRACHKTWWIEGIDS